MSNKTPSSYSNTNTTNETKIIPAERMKKGRPHRVPLTAQTLALLEVIDAITGDCEYIFPADKTNSMRQ